MKTQISSWQSALADVITDPAELFATLKLDPTLLEQAYKANQLFSLRVPRSFVARMKPGDFSDPLLQQVLPVAAELQQIAGFSIDPLNEQAANVLPGLLHKFNGRVLLVVSGGCAVHCRYCFRRHFPYEANNPGSKGWQPALDYISNDPTITEVIYSGGDPLLLKDNQLAELTEKIAAIPHVQRLRIHTRLPIVIPERVTSELIALLVATRLQAVVVVHCNHANEVDDDVDVAMAKLREHNITLLNQAVLLKGINDSVEALVDLSEALFRAGVLPYYLHLLDKVQGAAHFDVPQSQARKLLEQVSHRLPGYLVPRLAREEAGMPAKVLV